MTVTIGIDFDTRFIVAAAIPSDPEQPRRLWIEHTPLTTSPDVADRCLSARDAVISLVTLAQHALDADVTMLWVEEPWGSFRTADRALLPIYGALLASPPRSVARAGIPTVEWRRVLGLPTKLDKADSLTYARHVSGWPAFLEPIDGPAREPENHHEAEALLIALAGRHLAMRASA